MADFYRFLSLLSIPAVDENAYGSTRGGPSTCWPGRKFDSNSSRFETPETVKRVWTHYSPKRVSVRACGINYTRIVDMVAAAVRVQCKNYSYYARIYTGGRYETAYYDVDDLKKKRASCDLAVSGKVVRCGRHVIKHLLVASPPGSARRPEYAFIYLLKAPCTVVGVKKHAHTCRTRMRIGRPARSGVINSHPPPTRLSDTVPGAPPRWNENTRATVQRRAMRHADTPGSTVFRYGREARETSASEARKFLVFRSS